MSRQTADHSHVKADELEFDPSNPRFGGTAEKKTQDEIEEMLLAEPHYASELVDSLVENGFIEYEPLIVRRKRKSKYVVIEGNRRLAAIREIRKHPTKYPNKKSDLAQVPVLIFPDEPGDADENAARVYLGIRHLFGFREWPPLSKAQFLDKESQVAGSLDKVLKEVRLTRAQARRFLLPFRLLRAAKVSTPPGEDFWVLGEALGRTGVKDFLELEVDPTSLEVKSYNKAHLSIVLDDLYGPRSSGKKGRDASERKVEDTRDLSTFAKVLASEKARSVLHSGKGLEEAAIYVDTTEQSYTRLTRMLRETRLLIGKLMKAAPNDDKLKTVNTAFKQFEAAMKAYRK